jgi:glycosyltransferase involved in cell wall biosynthesis
MNVLLIYQFCTFGGVERMVLNRTMTFRKHDLDVRLSVGFLQDYRGALHSFQDYIRSQGLEQWLSAFIISEESFPGLNHYDLVLNIDTPQVFDRTSKAGNLFVECHTPYVENRQYLKNLPENVRGLLVPSESFKSLLLGEFDPLPPIYVLPNPVTDEFFNLTRGRENGIFSRRPLAYLARLDDLKNIDEAMMIFETLAGDDRMMFALVGRGAEEGRLLGELENKHLLGKTFLRDQLGFGDVPAFIRMVRDHRGIFLSPSKGESFGLSAAEFISGGVPVLLSDIPPHRELVNHDLRFLYPLGDIGLAREKIFHLVEEWDKASQSMLDFREKFRGIHFIKAWSQFSAADHKGQAPGG